MTTLEKTLSKLENKANRIEGSRMPSLLEIASLLSHYGIKHEEPTKSFSRSKKGYSMHIYFSGGRAKKLETTCSYYSMNSYSYAQFILSLINGTIK
jgi:hypothetical protein